MSGPRSSRCCAGHPPSCRRGARAQLLGTPGLTVQQAENSKEDDDRRDESRVAVIHGADTTSAIAEKLQRVRSASK